MEWKEVLLGELVEIKHGFAFKGEYFTEEKTNDILLTPGNFAIGGGFQWGKLKFYDGPIPSDYILTEGDLVVTMTDLSKAGDTLGYSAIIPYSENLLLHNQRVGKIKTKTSSVDKMYLSYQLRTKTYRNEVLASATGSTVKHTSPAKICAYRFLLPLLDEQKAIASVLGALDDKIENNRRMNETLEEMAQAIFKSWFVDFDPVHAKATGNTPAHMDAETAALFPSSFSDNGLPAGWSFSTIEEYGDVITGKTPSTKRSEYYGNEYPFIKIPNMTSVWVTETETALSEAGHLTQSKKLLQKGTVIVSCIASPGEVSIVSKPSHTNQQINAVVPNEDCPTSWLYCALANLRSKVIGMASGGSVTANLNKTDFSLIKIIHSSNAIMNSFDKKVCSLFDKILSNDEENQTLAKLRDILIPKLMSGEIRVKDAEREVEAAV
jgi:type I restriction enzyme S subunit